MKTDELNIKRVVIAGSTGYLGKFLVKQFAQAGFEVVALARSVEKLHGLEEHISQTHIVDIRNKDELKGLMDGADFVVTSVGITNQKEFFTYDQIDYQCNLNILNEAVSAGVKKFMYIAALQGDELRQLKIMDAKERFVDALKAAPIKSYIIRPSGFFSDVTEMYGMAKRGRVYVFGKGLYKANPIHGEDLGRFCLEKIQGTEGVYPIGGPEILTQADIGKIAFQSLNKKVKITKVPVWIAKVMKSLLQKFTNETYYGPIEFFLTVLTRDMVAPVYGKITLKEYFDELTNKNK